jgi:hypothetical protein
MQGSCTYRIVFLLAGIYNLIFAIWLALSPYSLFKLINSILPFPEILIYPISLSIVFFGGIFFYTALEPSKAYDWVAFGFLAKIGPPLLTVLLIFTSDWPVSILNLVFFNDVIWWIPIYLFLKNNKENSYLKFMNIKSLKK